MKTNKDIRDEAKLATSGMWFLRIAVVMVLLQGLFRFVNQQLIEFYQRNNIPEILTFLQRKAEHAQAGLEYTLPSSQAVMDMCCSSLFQLFITAIFASIASFGIIVIAIKAARREDDGWFMDSLSGFRRPLSLAWIFTVVNVKVLLWAILLIIPGIIAIYRYRLSFYLSYDHPDWSAAKCIEESTCLMQGHKWQAFGLDFSYFLGFILAGLVFSAALIFSIAAENYPLLDMVSHLIYAIGFAVLITFVIRMSGARGIFYKELVENQSRD